jgi:hypothetical protein
VTHNSTGDFFKEELPKADVIVMSLILHDWNLEKKKHLIQKAFTALSEDGVFIVLENLIDEERRVNTFGLMMSLNMLIDYGDAFDFTASELRDWALGAGFKSVKFQPLHDTTVAAYISKKDSP